MKYSSNWKPEVKNNAEAFNLAQYQNAFEALEKLEAAMDKVYTRCQGTKHSGVLNLVQSATRQISDAMEIVGKAIDSNDRT